MDETKMGCCGILVIAVLLWIWLAAPCSWFQWGAEGALPVRCVTNYISSP